MCGKTELKCQNQNVFSNKDEFLANYLQLLLPEYPTRSQTLRFMQCDSMNFPQKLGEDGGREVADSLDYIVQSQRQKQSIHWGNPTSQPCSNLSAQYGIRGF